MPNISYDKLQEDLVAVLQLDQHQEDYRLLVHLKMAVRDAIEEFVDNVGTRTTNALPIALEQDAALDEQVTRVYMPNDCASPRQLLINGYEVRPVGSDIYEKVTRTTIGSGGFYGKTVVREDGVSYVEVWPSITQTDALVTLTYRISSDDVGRIPEQYRNLIIYGAARHWYALAHTDNPIMLSRMDRFYSKYLARLRSNIANQNTKQLRPYETEWLDQFQFFIDHNDRDIRSI